MLWAFLVAAVIGSVVVVAREQGNEPMVHGATPSMVWRKARSLAGRAGGWARQVWDRRVAERRRPSFATRFSSRDGEWTRTHRFERVDWRERLVAVMELILFIVFLSALFAGALAAAALKIGHFHS